MTNKNENFTDSFSQKQISANMDAVQQMYTEYHERYYKLLKKRFLKLNDHETASMLSIIFLGLRTASEFSKTNLVLFNQIRDTIDSHYHAFDIVFKSVVALAEHSTNKELTNKLIKQIADTKLDLSNRIEDTRKEVEDIDKTFDDLFKGLSDNKGGNND